MTGEPSETPSSENVSPQRPRRIPDPVSYEPPSHSETQPRMELMRAAAHQVTPARTSYVSDPNMHELEQHDTPMVAVPPVSSDWRDTVDGRFLSIIMFFKRLGSQGLHDFVANLKKRGICKILLLFFVKI